MNRIYTLLIAAVCTLSASAQLTGDGYYRAQSSEQGRYINVMDNRGSVNLSTTDADMAALCTRAGFENIVSDPASIIYIKKMTTGYDFQTQGTSTYSIISYEIKLSDMGDNKYWCSASHAGMTKYLADEIINFMSTDEEKAKGKLVTNVSPGTEYEKYLDWNIIPVSAEDSYFGLQPNVAAGDSYYQTFYAAFPFTFYSEGMTAYYVSQIRESTGKVVVKEITGGVPTSTPVIIKCSAQDAASNKLNVGASASGTASGNKLTGVYFCNPNAGEKHTNVVAFDPTTMRVLGKAEDGSLAFVNNVDLAYIPANTAYITVSASAPAVLKVVTVDEADVLTLKADDKEMIYGDEVPTLTYSILDGEPDGTPTLTCEATKTSPVGTYPIKIAKGSLTNEKVTLQDGTLTIHKAPLTITATSFTITQGEALPTYTVTYDGFKNGETEEVLTKKPTVTCTATATSAPGTYEITVSGAEATNYEMYYVPGVLTIAEASAIQTVVSNSKRADVYDMSGRRVREQATTLEGLSKGIYIVNGRKCIVK